MKARNTIKRGNETLIIRTSKGGTRRQSRLISAKTCNNCHARFISNRTTAKFCCDSCRVLWHKTWKY